MGSREVAEAERDDCVVISKSLEFALAGLALKESKTRIKALGLCC